VKNRFQSLPFKCNLQRYGAVNLTGALNFHEGALVANYPWDGTDDSKTRWGAVQVECSRALRSVHVRSNTRWFTSVRPQLGSAWFQPLSL
jgi:hypothetical protein